eukprot:TRINITY_DN24001_c0_g1_i2.p1 TRINITY_DN24001_c0_g1~~TRINITY_DN24001_c0_g1_i2.p1  ORF type:complete len:132 (+),score=19.64 TRINITY_DN24001_c0_g1_i2:119-514(+)
MIRRPPRSTQGVSSAASDVYKRQHVHDPWDDYNEVNPIFSGTEALPQPTPKSERGSKMINSFIPFFLLGALLVLQQIKVNRASGYPMLHFSRKHLLGSFRFRQPSTPSHSCLLYTSPSPRDLSTSRMPSSA